MVEKLNITDWALDDRPREKLAAKGAKALSDAELLAILIGSGNTKETAVDLMRRILKKCDDKLSLLSRMSIDDLQKFDGVGPAKAITIQAACELGRRRSCEVAASQRMGSSADIAAFFRPKLQDLTYEECHVMLLNNKLGFIGSRCISKGGLTASAVDPRLALKEALLADATGIVLCHNHPSGSLQPSPDDRRVTLAMADACSVMHIKFIDHVIVSSEGYFSFNDEGEVPFSV